jgi:GTP 3',8-cyclase
VYCTYWKEWQKRPPARLAREHLWQMRFIELMPTTSQAWWQRHFLPMAEVHRRLAILEPLEPFIPEAASGPARTFRLAGFPGELGFISPMSQHHCRTCNRLRLTSHGKVRPCLLESRELDLKGPLRQGVADGFLEFLFKEATRLKDRKASHSLPCGAFCPHDPPMVSIGG